MAACFAEFAIVSRLPSLYPKHRPWVIVVELVRASKHYRPMSVSAHVVFSRGRYASAWKEFIGLVARREFLDALQDLQHRTRLKPLTDDDLLFIALTKEALLVGLQQQTPTQQVRELLDQVTAIQVTPARCPTDTVASRSPSSDVINRVMPAAEIVLFGRSKFVGLALAGANDGSQITEELDRQVAHQLTQLHQRFLASTAATASKHDYIDAFRLLGTSLRALPVTHAVNEEALRLWQHRGKPAQPKQHASITDFQAFGNDTMVLHALRLAVSGNPEADILDAQIAERLAILHTRYLGKTYSIALRRRIFSAAKKLRIGLRPLPVTSGLHGTFLTLWRNSCARRVTAISQVRSFDIPSQAVLTPPTLPSPSAACDVPIDLACQQRPPPIIVLHPAVTHPEHRSFDEPSSAEPLPVAGAVSCGQDAAEAPGLVLSALAVHDTTALPSSNPVETAPVIHSVMVEAETDTSEPVPSSVSLVPAGNASYSAARACETSGHVTDTAFDPHGTFIPEMPRVPSHSGTPSCAPSGPAEERKDAEARIGDADAWWRLVITCTHPWKPVVPGTPLTRDEQQQLDQVEQRAPAAGLGLAGSCVLRILHQRRSLLAHDVRSRLLTAVAQHTAGSFRRRPSS